MSLVHSCFASYGLSLQRDAFTYLNEAMSRIASGDKSDLLDQIAQEILNSNSNNTLSIGRQQAEDALCRLSNQSKREFDGADLTVLDLYQIKRPLFAKATNTFSISEEAPESAISTADDKVLSKTDRYDWLYSSIKGADGKLFDSITQIKNIIGKNGQNFTLFGMLTGTRSIISYLSDGRRQSPSGRQG
jgi:hypothetical protein